MHERFWLHIDGQLGCEVRKALLEANFLNAVETEGRYRIQNSIMDGAYLRLRGYPNKRWTTNSGSFSSIEEQTVEVTRPVKYMSEYLVTERAPLLEGRVSQAPDWLIQEDCVELAKELVRKIGEHVRLGPPKADTIYAHSNESQWRKERIPVIVKHSVNCAEDKLSAKASFYYLVPWL